MATVGWRRLRVVYGWLSRQREAQEADIYSPGAVIWDRWLRSKAGPAAEIAAGGPFDDLLEEAPVIALLVDLQERVIAANREARSYFAIDPERMPLGLVEFTRGNAVTQLLRAGRPENETRLVHQDRIVRSRLVPGPRLGETLVFLLDVTDLRRLETVRQEFVANISHELKTPLTSLRLAAESLAGRPPEQSRRRFAERVLQEVDHVTGIVDNLRQLAEIEAGGIRIEVERFSLAPVIDEVGDRLRIQDRLRLAIDASLEVAADRSKLAQAIGNLLDNAAKFSPAGSEIEVSARSTLGEVTITVRDHGPGISPEHWDRVFERFYKVDPARSRELSGTGLGLAITKHLVIAMGGQVWTEAAPGGGQVFGIRLRQPSG